MPRKVQISHTITSLKRRCPMTIKVIIPTALILMSFFTLVYFSIHVMSYGREFSTIMRHLHVERTNDIQITTQLNGEETNDNEMTTELNGEETNDSEMTTQLNGEETNDSEMTTQLNVEETNDSEMTTVKSERKFWDDFSPTFDGECLFSTNESDTEEPSNVEDFEFLKTDEGKKFKLILAWNHAYSQDYYFGFGHLPFKRACCKESRCFLTASRDQLPISDFDALLFHHRNLVPEMLPEVRTASQRWVFYEREPTPQSSKNPELYNGLFNWTMTYRWDSDVIARYGYIYPKAAMNLPSDERNSINTSSILNKGKVAAWAVSHCETLSQRENYVRELEKYIKVDTYGACGSSSCGEGGKCYDMIAENYKFSLAFENNLCIAYISERFTEALRRNIVPVVFGGADYDYVAPPHSYINARKFENEKALADYLTYLDNNDTAYLEYFRWKTDFELPEGCQQINFCNLCQKLHDNNLENKSYEDLREWFMGEGICENYP